MRDLQQKNTPPDKAHRTKPAAHMATACELLFPHVVARKLALLRHTAPITPKANMARPKKVDTKKMIVSRKQLAPVQPMYPSTTAICKPRLDSISILFE
jgi:hypothetical protein